MLQALSEVFLGEKPLGLIQFVLTVLVFWSRVLCCRGSQLCLGASDFSSGIASWALGVPTTPDPNTSAKVSRHKWDTYRGTNSWCIHYFLPRRGHAFAKTSRLTGRRIAIRPGSGVDLILMNVIAWRCCLQLPNTCAKTGRTT